MGYQPSWLFNAKVIIVEEQWYYLSQCSKDKGVHTFPKGISPKVNVIAWQGFELAKLYIYIWGGVIE